MQLLPGLGVLFAAALALVVGCASVEGEVLADKNPDTYTLTDRASPLQGGAREAAVTAMARADGFCRARRRRMLPLQSNESGWPIQQDLTGPTGFTLRFLCRTPDTVQMNVGNPE